MNNNQTALLKEIYRTAQVSAPVQRFTRKAEHSSCKAGCNGSCSGLTKVQDYPKEFYA